MPTTLKAGGSYRGDWTVAYAKVTAAETFKQGDLVQFADAGTVSIAATAGNAVGNIRWGIAGAGAADALTDDRPIPVYMPSGNDALICLPVYHGTAASAVLTAADRATAAGAYGITLPAKNVGGVWVADLENDGTNDCLTLVEPVSPDQYSEQYGLFWWAVHHDRALIGDQT